MDNAEFSNITDRIKRLERQNLILKIIGFAALLFVAFNFGTGKNSVEQSEIKAQKFVLVNEQGTECGYLGYDTATKNPRLSLKQCNDGTPERIGLIIEKDSASMRLNAGGYPTASITANRRGGNAKLQLTGENRTGKSNMSAYLSSGTSRVAPHFYLEGRENGRIDLFSGKDFFTISEEVTKNRFTINKISPDSIGLQFFAKDGRTKTFEVPHK